MQHHYHCVVIIVVVVVIIVVRQHVMLAVREGDTVMVVASILAAADGKWIALRIPQIARARPNYTM